MVSQRVVIVGAGQAGVSVARALRTEGFLGEIVMLGAERHLPYERPPLSKEVLKGSAHQDEITLMSPANFESLNIQFLPSSRCIGLDINAYSVWTDTGVVVPFGYLVLATGGGAREMAALPADGESVFSLRTIDDALEIRSALFRSKTVLVVGAGWLGLEIAATAREVGLDVHVVETADRVCARSLPEPISRFLEDLHHRRGVRLHLGERISSVEKVGGAVHAKLSNGVSISAEMAVVAIGLVPNDQLARDAGLRVEDGVLTDGAGRTSESRIFAIGDVARSYHDRFRRHIRLESWQNANSQGDFAAKAIMERPARYEHIPWFWSHQFGHRLQVAGLPDLNERGVFDRSIDNDRWVWRQSMEGRTTCVVAFNDPKAVRDARRELERFL